MYNSPGGTTNVVVSCFAQLKYRAVEIWGIEPGNHSFWWSQDSTGQTWVDDAGPTGNCAPNCGYLNSWGTPGFVGHYSQDDARTAATAWSSPLNPSICQNTHNLAEFQINWPEYQIGYATGAAPNSNTWAHDGANAAPFTITTPPPKAPGW